MGQVTRERRLEVKAPPGVKTGSRVRVAGEGRPGVGGGPNGDLYLVVTVLAHSRFERRGDDLLLDVPVPFTEAVLGGEVEVQTIDGRIAMRVPELTQNGRQIRLAGKGMPVLGTPGQRGDLITRVRVLLPERLTPRRHARSPLRVWPPTSREPRSSASTPIPATSPSTSNATARSVGCCRSAPPRGPSGTTSGTGRSSPWRTDP